MRFLRSLRLLITEGADGTPPVYFDDGQQLSRTETEAAFITVHNDGQLRLDNADGLVSIPFGDVATAKAVLIAPSGPITFRINGGTVDLPVGAPAQGRGVLYWEGDITEIRVANPDSANAVSVLYALVGVE